MGYDMKCIDVNLIWPRGWDGRYDLKFVFLLVLFDSDVLQRGLRQQFPLNCRRKRCLLRIPQPRAGLIGSKVEIALHHDNHLLM